MTDTPPRDQSDQLPEEGPPGTAPDDDGQTGQQEAPDNPGVPGEDETGTGNPDAAGSDE